MRDKAVMMSSTTPSVKYSCSMSPLRFRNGSAAIEGPSGKGRRLCDCLARCVELGADRGGAIGDLADLADEPESLAGDRSKQALVLPAVADGLARRVDVTGQGRFRDNPAGPHGIQELVLADDVLAVPQQMEQQVEDLRPDGDRLGAARELPPVRVDHEVLERVLHVALS
jgi:hypothetical protein